jgi:sec-independent protein translocase protein TatC
VAAKNDNELLMSILDHLDELRKRIMIIAIILLVGALASFFFVTDILDFLTAPAKGLQLIYITPAEAFVSQIRLAIVTAVIITLPLTIYQILLFILPALKQTEKRAIYPFVFAMFILFGLGVSFAYFVVLPFALFFFLGFSTETLVPQFTISSYISFVTSFLLAFGSIFQIPLVFWFLGAIGLVSSGFLRTNRKYAVLIIAIISAVITPPDVFSQLLMVGPLMLLYETGILLIRLTERKRARQERRLQNQ